MSRKQDYDWDQISEWRTSLKLSYRNLRKKCLEEWGRTPSLSSISYHFGETTKTKQLERQKKYQKTLRGKINKKIADFKVKEVSNYIWPGNKHSENPRENIRLKVKGYKDKKMSEEIASKVDTSYGIEDVISFLTEKHGLDIENKTAVSALTGELVDLTKEFHLDHWDNNAGNALENMCILTRKENMMKGELSMEDLLHLCEKTLEKHKQ